MTATPILSSTLFLTVLSFIGLIFFIRASVK
ncbi:MAG: cofactor assembly of complex C subunit B, partial [Microcystaceae cyanobacterium]